MQDNKPKLAWVGLGRMGTPMAKRLLEAGYEVSVWNRTAAKAEPLKAAGARVVGHLAELAACDVVFSMVSTGEVLKEIYFGTGGIAVSGNGKRPRVYVDCSSIAVEQSAEVRQRLEKAGAGYIASPVSGNGKCVKAGKLSAVASGPRALFDEVEPCLAAIAGAGVSYVGEGELSRICKIAHNVLLGVLIQNLCETAILAQKAGVPRHAFLDFINKSVLGSVFTRYKTPALVNLDWTTTFTPSLLRKDLDLGLAAARTLGVSVPITAATREALQSHFGTAILHGDPGGYLEKDFSAILETVALGAGLKLESEDVPVKSGLE